MAGAGAFHFENVCFKLKNVPCWKSSEEVEVFHETRLGSRLTAGSILVLNTPSSRRMRPYTIFVFYHLQTTAGLGPAIALESCKRCHIPS
jgi:hypothetical protein